ncbi:MAG: GAF domain-containing protein [Anaerolineae bacterium]|nr:GAF domain-containing protein [Anaerolineae bacterium]MCX8068099.1 GAF domain-containing protein [Anaerolineae bacterium]MDW7992493.1 GAF domain-containing protein [Anaerolineae bacterium]
MRSDLDVWILPRPTLRTTRKILLVILGLAALALALAALLAARTASAPFPGFFTEPTLVVTNIGSPSWSGHVAGLHQPDQILAVDGTLLNRPGALVEALRSYRPGETVRLRVRNPETGEVRQVQIPLIPFPAGVFLNFFLVPYGVGLLYWVVGGWLLIRHGLEEAGQVLALLCIAVALTLGLFFDLHTTHRLFALWVPAIPLVGSVLLHLAFVFPHPAPAVSRYPWLRALFYLPALALAAAGLITTMDLAHPTMYFGPWMGGRGWVGIGALVFIGTMVYHRVSARSPIVRAQANIILIGALLSFLPFLVWIPLGFRPGFPFRPALYLPPFLIFPVAIALALYYPRALNVDWAIRSAAAYLLLTVLVVGVFFLAFLLLEQWLLPTLGPLSPLLLALLAFLAALGVPPIRALIQYAIDFLLLGRKVPPERALREFADRAATAHTLQDIIRHLADVIQRALAPSCAVLYLREARGGTFVPYPLLGPSMSLPAFPPDSPLAHHLLKERRALYLAVDDNLPAELEEEEARLEALGPALFAPLNEWGWLVVGPTRLERFRARDIWFLEALTPQIIVALERVQRILETEKWAQRLEGLNEVSSLLTSTLDLDTVLHLTVQRAADLLNAEAASLLLVDETTGDLVFRVAIGVEGLEGARLPMGTGLAGWVAQEGRPVRVEDVRQDPRWYPGTDRRHSFITRSLLGVPLSTRGKVIGVLEVLNRRDRRPFDEEDERLLCALAAHAASAIENARLFALTDQALAARVEELAMMQQIDRELNATLDYRQTLEVTLDWAMRRTGAEVGLIGVLEEEEGKQGLRLLVGRGYPEEIIQQYQRSFWPIHQGIIGRVARTGQPELVTDVRQDPDYVAVVEDTIAQITVPIRREDRIVGIIALETSRPDRFTQETLDFVVRLADHAAIAIENARLFAAVDAANQAKTEFISFVSHELKQPMTAIKGYTDLLAKGLAGDLTEMQRSFLEVIRSNVNRMDTMVQELLDISRIESGRLRLEIGRVSVQEAVEEAVRTLRQEIEAKKQSLEITIADGLPPVAADRTRLVQILTNLLSNAYKYTPEGGRIRVSAEPANGCVRFSVSDTGIGITPEDQERLFTKFFRSQDPVVRSVPGTGLGLAITKSLVELQGGQIWVESQPGVGSTFTFTLPIYEPSVQM